MIHSTQALLATGFVFAIHFFNTHLRPEKFPADMSVLTGLVSEEEMRRGAAGVPASGCGSEGELEELRVPGAASRGTSGWSRCSGFVALAVGLALAGGHDSWPGLGDNESCGGALCSCPERVLDRVRHGAAMALSRNQRFALASAVRWVAIRRRPCWGVRAASCWCMAGAAGWYTSRPQFCNSCHIMEPYYKSWQESSHKDVSCIECHFPPGFGGKVRGKMLGLVQLAKYVTASEGPRPAAEIPDASCLRSGCHETRLLSGRVDFQRRPLRPHARTWERCGAASSSRCTSCHSQIVQGKHMTVTTSTCFLCHFKGEPFNEGLGACTRCHQIPDKKFDLGGGVMFTHDLAYEKGVDCANCHGDLIRGKGEVPRERCLVCHNREDDLERIDDHEFMHQKHVTDHKIDCLQCHLQIQHSLDSEKIVHAAAELPSPAIPTTIANRSTCSRGVGGKTISPHASGMLAVPRRVQDLPSRWSRKSRRRGPCSGRARPNCALCATTHDAVKQFETYHVQSAGLAAGVTVRRRAHPRGAEIGQAGRRPPRRP